ncbi:MAG: TIGR02281 family clan AA aspartic protease [Gammaproteobacteria bacterium]|nr:MAG: TIGR02281 family clan AA aspartic protease [Gammaproteobacteria bacterium]
MKLCLTLFFCVFTHVCSALEIEAKMLAQGSAVLMIDGTQRMLREGSRSPEGVLLVSANGKQAILEIDGKRKTISLSRSIGSKFEKAGKKEIRLASGQGGHYYTKGLINGAPVDFLVDTGATYVAMTTEQAEQLGLDYRGGVPTETSTANGVAKAFRIVLNSVAVGNIVVHQVTAFVIKAPTIGPMLLGNAYLSRVDLKIDQGVMVLSEK